MDMGFQGTKNDIWLHDQQINTIITAGFSYICGQKRLK